MESRILLVIRQDSADAVLRIIEAVVRGGVKVIEITLTVPDALSMMQAAVKEFGKDALIGAGTVLDS
jgi:2-dehydro-3-deoxyphosphogluconate aldolase/(4S)-4-hydroxy-2-oxoglutarate aldolase